MAAPALVFHERKTHVPTWCPWQTKSPEEMRAVTVKANGVPLRPGFSVDRVAPDRRWAIQDDGEVLPQNLFERDHLRKYREWFRVAYNPPARIPGKETCEPVPNVLEYVSFEVDPTDSSRLRQIGYDPHANRGRRPTHLVDKNGENPRPYDEVILEQYDRDPSKLKESERKYAASLRGERSDAGAPELHAKLKLLAELRQTGAISDSEFAKQAIRLTGAKLIQAPDPAATPDPAPDAQPEPATKAAFLESGESLACGICGKKLPTEKGRTLHERFCKNKKG